MVRVFGAVRPAAMKLPPRSLPVTCRNRSWRCWSWLSHLVPSWPSTSTKSVFGSWPSTSTWPPWCGSSSKRRRNLRCSSMRERTPRNCSRHEENLRPGWTIPAGGLLHALPDGSATLRPFVSPACRRFAAPRWQPRAPLHGLLQESCARSARKRSVPPRRSRRD